MSPGLSRFTHGLAQGGVDGENERSPVAEATEAYAAELRQCRERRGLSKQALADRMAYDRSYVSHIERGTQAPTEGFTARAEDVLDAAGALQARWESILYARATQSSRGHSTNDRDLQTVEFVAWLAERTSTDFLANYREVASAADRLSDEPSSKRHARAHDRAQVGREDLAAAVAAYYGAPGAGDSYYQATIDGQTISTSILTQADWLGTAVELGGPQESFALDPEPLDPPMVFDESARRAAIMRLAEVESTGTVMVNSPTFRLTDIDLRAQHLRATAGLSDFATFALSTDLMESELVDLVVSSEHGPNNRTRTPVRDVYLPTIDQAKDLGRREAAGGPACLLAIARPARGGRPPDYALLVQERSGRVLNAAGKLAVIPKAFHQPIGEPADEVALSATLLREFEEELLGRQDLEQLSEDSWKRADALHEHHRSEPLAWLVEHHNEGFAMECAGFGINLITGTYEFACLMVIDDESWWERWGHLVEANWEAMRVNRYSSLDTNGLTKLALDGRWSNEGLFAFLEGLRRLDQRGDAERLTVPTIEIGAH